ncbi:hypothetical protein [Streptomyces sp. WAC 04229]|uniref:hypothetical protein n=1 Tax=Streptomyces sp. WAC 04229 TaxID=2203206 RepID=UPI003D710177
MSKQQGKKYIEEMRATISGRIQPSWPVFARPNLGDVGVLRDGEFERKGTFEELYGVRVASRPAPDSTSRFHCDSSGSVRLHTTMGAGAGGVTDASLALDFDRADAVLFHAIGCRSQEIENIHEVEARMKERHAQGLWPRNYVVVTEVTLAERTTVLMSDADGDRVELKAAAAPGLAGFDLLTSSLGVSWVGGTSTTLQILSEGDLVPLYRVRGMVRRLMRDAEPSFLGGKDAEPDVEWYADEVTSDTHDVGGPDEPDAAAEEGDAASLGR